MESPLELNQQIWIPLSFVWETDHSLLLKVITVEEFDNVRGQLDHLINTNYYFIRLEI